VGCRGYLHRVEPPVVSPLRQDAADLTPAVLREVALARVAWEEGNLDEAAAHLRLAVALDPSDAHLRVLEARLATEKGERERASRILEAASEAFPQDVEVLSAWGRALLNDDCAAQAVIPLRTAALSGGGTDAWAGLLQALVASADPDGARHALDEWVVAESPDADGRWERASLAMRLGDACHAMDDLSVLVDVRGAEPFLLDPYIGAARVCVRYRTAQNQLLDLTRSEPSSTALWERLARFCGEIHDPVCAADAWSHLERLTEDVSSDLLLAQAAALGDAGRPSEALAVLDRVPADAPGARYQRARALRALGDPKAAWKLYARGESLSFQPEVRLLAEILVDVGRREEAATVLEKGIAALGPLHGMVRDLARIRLEQRRPEDAWAVLTRAAEVFPGAVRMEQATLLAESGDLGGALSAAREADAQHPESSVFLGEVVRLLVGASRLPEAKVALDALRSRFPADADVARMEGFLAQREGRTDDAIRWYRSAVALDARSPEARNDLAFTLAEAGQSLDEAARFAVDALEWDPANPSFLDTLGWVYRKQGRFAEAIVELRRAVWLEPENRTFLGHLVVVYEAAGRRPEAAAVQARIDAIGKGVQR